MVEAKRKNSRVGQTNVKHVAKGRGGIKGVGIVERSGYKMRGDDVLVPAQDFRRMYQTLSDMEDMADLHAYVEAKAADEESFPSELVEAVILGKSNPVKAFREHRGLTQEALAKKSGVKQNMISMIENGKRDGTMKVMSAIASALNIDLDMLDTN